MTLGNEGVDYGAVEAGDTIDIGDPEVTIEVLGPILEHPAPNVDALRWFSDKSHTINGHSVVLRLTYGDVRLLFSGDLNEQGAGRLLADPSLAAKLDAHVLKAPHHGSHEYAAAFLARRTRRSRRSRRARSRTTGIPVPTSWLPPASTRAATCRCSTRPRCRRVFGQAEKQEHQDAVDELASSPRPTTPRSASSSGSCWRA